MDKNIVTMDKNLVRRSTRRIPGSTGDALVGRITRKRFGRVWYWGEVKSYVAENELYQVVYEDGDCEDLALNELRPLMRPVGEERPAVPARQAHIDMLPTDVLENIFALLNDSSGLDVLNCMQVCKRWKDAVPPAVTTMSTAGRSRLRMGRSPWPFTNFPNLQSLHLHRVWAVPRQSQCCIRTMVSTPATPWVPLFEDLKTHCPKLKAIYFAHVRPRLRNEDVEVLLVSCPALKTIEIHSSAGFRRITDPEAWSRIQNLSLSHNEGLRKIQFLDRLDSIQSLSLRATYSLKPFPSLKHLKTSLQTLDISGAHIRKLPDLPPLPLLASLSLRFLPNLKALPPLSHLTALTSLVVLKCPHITDAPDLPTPPSLLKHLAITRCSRLLSAPPLEEHTKLELLDLSKCQQLFIIPGLTEQNLEKPNRLPKLRQLSLPNSTHLDIPGLSLPSLTQLEILRVDLRAPYVPRVLACLPQNLRSLTLVARHWRGSIPSLTNLESLSLQGGIKYQTMVAVAISLPTLEGSFPSLRSLDLADFQEYRLNLLANLSGLETMTVTNVGLESLKECSELSSLQSLHLIRCSRLRGIFEEENTGLKKLRVLVIQKCQLLSTFDSTLSWLKLLETLVVQECPLMELTKLSSLQRLRTLKLERCRLLSKIASLRNLRQLHTLFLHSLPKLTKIRGFKSLSHLQVLSIKECLVLSNYNEIGNWAQRRRPRMHILRLRTLNISSDTEGSSASDGLGDSSDDASDDDLWSDDDSFDSDGSGSSSDHESDDLSTDDDDDDVDVSDGDDVVSSISSYDDSDDDCLRSDHESDDVSTDDDGDDVDDSDEDGNLSSIISSSDESDDD